MSFLPNLELVHNEIEESFLEHVKSVQEFLRQPSISSENLGLIETANLLKGYLENAGGEVIFCGEPAAPIVHARFDYGKPKTLLVYGMYDTQPVEGQQWSVPPFSANIIDIPGIGPSIVARGACNSKGPLIGFINSILSINKVDELPVNLILTIEGEEEIGSPTLPKFYKEHKHLLEADAGFEPFWADYGTDVVGPTLALGNKGIIGLELICHGGDWGGPVTSPIHSSASSWIASPILRLIRAVSSFHDQYENIIIDHFFEEVEHLSAEDNELLRKLAEAVNEDKILEFSGARQFKLPFHGAELLRRSLFSPSISIGFDQRVPSDIIPTEARAVLTIRTVPNMEVEHTIEIIREHLDHRGYKDISIKKLFSYPYSRTSLSSQVVKAMLQAYEYHGAVPNIYPLMASSTPYYLFSQILGIQYTMGGLGKAGRSHAPDEFVSIDGLKMFEKSLATFLYFYAFNS